MLLNNTRLSSNDNGEKLAASSTSVPNREPLSSNAPFTRSCQQKRKSEQFRTPAAKIIRRSNGGVGASKNGIDDPVDVNTENERLQADEEDSPRTCPLPPVKFADGFGLWDLMCETDKKYVRSPDPFRNHPALSPQMRAILLDWMMDVCEAYNLHRETLYLSIDYLDRYLSTEQNLRKDHLQLIGISCLFIASKVEEIYPPKLTTFAYVTDGACTEADIVASEMLIMKTLKWNLTPITPCNWINVYLQVLSHAKNSRPLANGTRTSPRSRSQIQLHRDIKASLSVEGEPFLWPQYSGTEFVRALRILDLASLDTKFLSFKYSVLGAAAIHHIKGKEAALECSRYSWEAISACASWLAPFAQVVKRSDVPEVLPSISNVSEHGRHLIQSHCVTLSMLERVQFLHTTTNKLLSPLTNSDGLLTPPKSGEKQTRQKRWQL